MTTKRLDYAEAAAYIGVRVGTLRTMVYRKQVPHIRLSGKLVRFDIDEIDKWLRAHSVAVNGERP